MFRRVFSTTVAGSLLGLLSLTTSASAQYAVVGQTSTEIGDLTRVETTVQQGPLPINQFKMLRVSETGLPAEQVRAVVFLLPALGVEFSSYETTAPRKNPHASLVGFLARRKMVVYGYSSRAEGLAAGGCEAGVFDCSPMADWGFATLLDDIDYVRSAIAAEDPGLPVFVGGHSLGGISALAAINQFPTEYDGAFIWEGIIGSTDAAVQTLNQGYCAALEAQLAAGLVYDGFGNNLLKKISQAARLAPAGLTPIPLFPSFLNNQQVLVSSLATPAPGPFSMPVPGYVLAAGDPVAGDLFHADEARLHSNIGRFNDYVPLAAVRDLSCSLAGSETAFNSNLNAFTGPILGIGGDLGFGPYMLDNLSQTDSNDITLLLEPGFGHVDQLLSENHRMLVARPLFRWIMDRLN